jgi:hypothetical protein
VVRLAGELAAREQRRATPPATSGNARRVSLASEVGW